MCVEHVQEKLSLPNFIKDYIKYVYILPDSRFFYLNSGLFDLNNLD